MPPKVNIQYSITISQNNGHEYISRLEVQLNRSKFEFVLPDKAENSTESIIYVDSKQIPSYPATQTERLYLHGVEYTVSDIWGYTLPTLSGVINMLLQELFDKIPEDKEEHSIVIRHRHDYSIVTMQFIGQCLCLGTAQEEIQSFLAEDGKGEFDIIEKTKQQLALHLNKFSESRIQDTFSLFKLLYFYSFFPDIEEYLNVYFRQVHYIAPVRATAERYYRLRNLAIDEVDYQGKNLAMFLGSLSDARLRKFKKWTEEYFNFSIAVEKKGGHSSIKIESPGSEKPINMSDTGFGYSQILPIITQLWDLSTKPKSERINRKNIPLVIAIEQPELHLHPALQAKLAKALLSSIQLAKNNGYNLQLIIETHSETIVNYFGMAVANGTLQKEDISVILFEKDFQTKYTQVQSSTYDQDGYLLNWPIGFFAPKEW